jgi:hypothetical protein
VSNSHAKRGSSLPEAAVIMICLLTLTFGLWDFGRLVYTYAWAFDIVQKAQRWTIVRGQDCTNLKGDPTTDTCPITATDTDNYIKHNAFGVVNPTAMTVSAIFDGPSGSPSAPGSLLVIYLTVPFNFMLPFMPKSSISLTDASRGKFQ